MTSPELIRGAGHFLKTSGLTTNCGRLPERTSTTPSAAPVAIRITHSWVSAALCGERMMLSSSNSGLSFSGGSGS